MIVISLLFLQGLGTALTQPCQLKSAAPAIDNA